MADRKVTIDIETRKTGTGTEAAVKELGGLSASASRAQGNVSESFKKIQASVGRVTGAVGALRNLFMGFGIAQAAVAVIGQFKAIKDEIDAVKKAQEELKTGLEDIRKAAAEGFSAKLIADLTSSLKKANDELDRVTARAQFQKTAARAAEDAQAEADKAAELAAVSPGDPLAAAKKGEIAAKYASAEGVRAARRKLEDIREAERKNDDKRATLLEEANTLELSARLKDKDEKILRMKADDTKVSGDALVLPKWWQFWKNPAPDPKAQLEAAKAAAAINEKAYTASEEAKKLRDAASSKRADADLLLDRAEAYGVERGAAYTQLQTARLTGSVQRREAGAATEAARIGYINGGMRQEVYSRLDSGIVQLEKSPTAQKSPEAQKLLASAQAFRKKVEGMDMEAFLAAFKEISAALDRFDVRLADAKRAAQQMSSRAARQRDND